MTHDDYLIDEDSRTLDVLNSLREIEEVLRELGTEAGRGPRGLAFNALATDTWKIRATLTAIRSGGLPVEL